MSLFDRYLDWKNLCVNKILFNVVYSKNNMLLTVKLVIFLCSVPAGATYRPVKIYDYTLEFMMQWSLVTGGALSGRQSCIARKSDIGFSLVAVWCGTWCNCSNVGETTGCVEVKRTGVAEECDCWWTPVSKTDLRSYHQPGNERWDWRKLHSIHWLFSLLLWSCLAHTNVLLINFLQQVQHFGLWRKPTRNWDFI